MKVSNRKQLFFLLLTVCLATAYGLNGCGDDSLDAEPVSYSSNLVKADPPTISDFAKIWSGTMAGVMQGMSGPIVIDLTGATVNPVTGTVTVSGMQNTPTTSSVTINGAVGSGATDPLAGIYSLSLALSAPEAGCYGWNVVGAATLNEAKTELSVTCVGIFCNTDTGYGSLGISTGVLTETPYLLPGG